MQYGFENLIFIIRSISGKIWRFQGKPVYQNSKLKPKLMDHDPMDKNTSGFVV